jgi:hypothetical protein
VLKETGPGRIVSEELGEARQEAEGHVAVPIALCVALGWILWRLRAPALRDEFQ